MRNVAQDRCFTSGMDMENTYDRLRALFEECADLPEAEREPGWTAFRQ